MHMLRKHALTAVLMLSFASMVQLNSAPAPDKVFSPRETLDDMFAESPVLLARLEDVATKASNTLEKIKGLTTLSSEDIKQYVSAVSAPVKGFFGELRSNSTLLKPLLQTIITNRSSVLLDFFEQSNTNTFFENKITTKEALETTLNELITLKDDLMQNLDKDTKSVYDSYKTRALKKKEAVA